MTRVLLVALAAALSFASTAHAFDPAYEAANYNKINERAATDYTPEFNAQLAQQGLENQAAAASIVANDGADTGHQYGRDFSGNLCANPMNGCAGDVRLYDWGEKGYGIVKPILFTARNGSTLSGHVWMTARGPKTRPGVVITNGSVQAPETLYWYAAQTLAEAGYVVMTWDPQGQGYSDTYGEGVDRNDGFPSQTGEPFYDGTEDALDFFFSTPAKPYLPRPSCSSNTSHADKQQARVKDGRSSAYNPFFASLDTEHVGIAGHSLGAAAVSYVGQLDPRVKAIVAWDNLNDVTKPGAGADCASGSSPRPDTLKITKPALGMSSDYYLTPMPYTADPTADQITSKTGGSKAASKAGVDTGQIMIRGGTHYEYSYIPNPGFGATRRGMDMVAWYTLAWMDKELRNDPTAGARLLTTRWQDDRLEKAVDAQTPPDGNLFSTYFPSRLDISTAGGHFTCEDLRKGCAPMAPDGLPADYSFLAATQVKDTAPGGSTAPAGSTGTPPAATGPQALQAQTTPGCRPRSHIDRITHRGRRYTFKGTARTRCEQPVKTVRLIIRRHGHHRTVTAKGTSNFRLTITLRKGVYRIAARTITGVANERKKRGHRVRVR